MRPSLVARSRGVCRVLLLSVLAVAVGCKRPGSSAGGFPLAPAAQAHETSAGTLVWPSVEGSLADVAAVAKKLGFPLSPENMKASLLAKAPWAEAAKQIDLAKPVAVVFFADPPSATGAKKDAAGTSARGFSGVAAFALRAGGPTTVDEWAKTLGTVVERRQDAVAVRAAGADASATPDTFYLLMRDGAVLLAEGWKSLEDGGALALAARGNGAKSPILSLRLEGIARSKGITLADAMVKARTELQQGLAATNGKPMPDLAKAMLAGMTDMFFDWGQSTEAVEVSATLNDTQGLAFTTALRPKSGTRLAQIAASLKPYAIEPALLGGPPAAFLGAIGPAPLLQKDIVQIGQKMLDSMPAGQSKKEDFRHLIDLMADVWTRPGTVAFRPTGAINYEIVYDVGAAKGAALMDGLAKIVGPSPLGDLGAVDPALAGSSYVLEKDGDVFWGHLSSPKAPKDKAKKAGQRDKKDRGEASPLAQAPTAAFLGTLEMRMVVDGDKMIAISGPNGKARLEALRAAVKAPAATPSGPLAAELESTKGAWFFERIDVGDLVRGMAGIATQSPHADDDLSAQQMAMMQAMFGDAHLELVAEGRGGDTLSFTMRVPIDTALSGAMLASRFMMGPGPGLGAPASGVLAPAPSAVKHRKR